MEKLLENVKIGNFFDRCVADLRFDSKNIIFDEFLAKKYSHIHLFLLFSFAPKLKFVYVIFKNIFHAWTNLFFSISFFSYFFKAPKKRCFETAKKCPAISKIHLSEKANSDYILNFKKLCVGFSAVRMVSLSMSYKLMVGGCIISYTYLFDRIVNGFFFPRRVILNINLRYTYKVKYKILQ